MENDAKNFLNDPCNDPKFLSSLFFKLIPTSSHFLSDLYHMHQEAEFSYYFDLSALQDSFRFRALRRARAITQNLINENAELDESYLKQVIAELQSAGHVFYPEGFNDSAITQHAVQFLMRLYKEKNLIKMINRFRKPLYHKGVERLVFDTLGYYHSSNVNKKMEMTNRLIRQAILCVCLTPLRQNIGSCFASAPAILIQREQVDSLLEDLYQLLNTGKLKRTFEGKEYFVPLSSNTGVGDLRKNLFHLDIKARSCFSPGLIAACQMLEVIPSNISYAKKAQLLEEKLSEFMQGKHKMTIEQFIHDILLSKMQIKEEDLLSAAHLDRNPFNRKSLLQNIHERESSKKIDLLEQFNQKKRDAIAALMGVCDNALLKAWEFTLASFVDVKMEFARWNLYKSLGLSVDEPGGIGELIFKHIDEKLQKINVKIEHFQQESKAAFDAAKATEGLLRQAGSEAEARRLQAEYQSRSYHMHACLEARDQLYSEGSHYSTFFNFLLQQFDLLFPEYFQEIFDPNMVEPDQETYDDSRAGFRLVYKHGRSDPSQWTWIYDASQYIDSLVDFFSTIESRISGEMQWEEGKKELSLITTALLSHLRSNIFLTSATQRVSENPVSSLTKTQKEKKPWGYISGGTMTHLLKAYFCKENDYTKEEKWVENESELLSFIVDTFKNLIPLVTNPFIDHPNKGMLMTSPTHAFILLPGQKKLSEGWQENGFTYTWVRDQIVSPGKKFYTSMHLSMTQQIFLFDAFAQELYPMLSHALNQALHIDNTSISVMEWRNKILETLMFCSDAKLPFQKRAFEDGLDAFLYQVLPIIPGSEWKSYVKQLLFGLYDDPCRESLYQLNDSPCAYMTAKQIKELAKSVYIHAQRSLFFSFDLHHYIAERARFIDLAPPTSLIFADTNWANQYFGFVVNPGTNHLELWSLDRTASQGTPMSHWKQWLNGSHQRPWTLYVNPREYTSVASSPLNPLGKV